MGIWIRIGGENVRFIFRKRVLVRSRFYIYLRIGGFVRLCVCIHQDAVHVNEMGDGSN